MVEVVLWSCGACPYAQRARIVLLAKEVPNYKINDLDNDILLKKKEKPQELLRKNPYGAVPVLDHGNHSIYESAIIMTYLEDAFPGGVRLLPSDPKGRSVVSMLIADCDKKITTMYPLMFNKDEAKTEEFEKNFTDALQFLDDKFNNISGDYFAGDEITLADVAFVPFFERIKVAVEPLRGKKYLENFINLNNWYKRMQSFQPFVDSRMEQSEMLEFYKKYINK
ncbi:glutathione S-transferase [Acrasis kona]|uniref:Glutathione S-transferase n=1 Tax=Acrasis kona TaxID=1008807 RepID=A0AAW2ZET8_9EUKA